MVRFYNRLFILRADVRMFVRLTPKIAIFAFLQIHWMKYRTNALME